MVLLDVVDELPGVGVMLEAFEFDLVVEEMVLGGH